MLDTPPAYWPFIDDATISLDDLPAIIELHTNHTTDTGPLVAALRAGNRTIGHLVTTVRRDLIRASRIVEITAAAAETGTRIVEWHGE